MKRDYPLHVHVSTVFLCIVLVMGGVTAWVSYKYSYDILESSASGLTQRISDHLVSDMRGILAPANLAVEVLSHDSYGEDHNLKTRWQRLDVAHDILKHSSYFSSIYVGYETGDFISIRPLYDEAERLTRDAPSTSRYMVQSIERGPNKAVGKHFFLDPALQVLDEVNRPNYASQYDPRARKWYQRSIGEAELITMQPYLFYSDRKVGITVAKRLRSGKGVVGVDILLETLGKRLAEQQITPNSQLAIVNAAGMVLAHKDVDQLVGEPTTPGGPPSLKRLDTFGVPALASAFPALEQHANAQGYNGQARIEHKGREEEWRVVIRQIAVDGTEPLYLVTLIPYTELFAAALKMRDTSLLITLLMLLISIPITWGVGKMISRSLHRLAVEAKSIQHFDFAKPIRVRSTITEVHELALTMDSMKRTIRKFLTVSQAVATEENFECLLPMLLRETLTVCSAQAGVLYLADDQQLVPSVALDAQGADVMADLLIVPLTADIALLHQAIDERAPVSGELSAAEAEQLGLTQLIGETDTPHSVIVPLMNRQHQLVGLLLLLRHSAIEATQLAFVGALSGFSSSSLETRELIKAQKALFEAFVQLIAGAIDAKSPYTGDHCARVPELTKMLARAACDAEQGHFADFRLDENEWEAVHVAAWLHDCGKVTTPEYVVDKATKLESLYDRIHEVRMRFEVLKRDAEISSLKAIATGANAQDEQSKLAATLQQLDDDFAFVATCNEGGEFMAPEKVERLQAIATRTWLRTLDDRIGIAHEELERKQRTPSVALPATESLLADKPEHLFERSAKESIAADNEWGFRMKVPEKLYNKGELYNLAVGRGTLSEEERYKINEHIVQTIIMLSRLPFPKHLRHVPEIAGGHHEKMDGTGYPKRLTRDEMSPVARMMAVADIFEALTAADRPYKKGKLLSESIKIMSFMKKDQHIDPDIFDLFLRSGVYLDYAKRYMNPAQIDTVDIAQYLQS